MQLKISSITNLTDARFFSASGAHYLGFCFDVLNENYIDLKKTKEIVTWLHTTNIIGEFGHHQAKEEIEFIAQQIGINDIQIPFQHPQKQTLNFEKFIVVDDFMLLENEPTNSDFFVLKISSEDLYHPTLKTIISKHNVFLETDFTKENFSFIANELQPYGIQISCKKEEKVGFSAVDEYAELLDFMGFL